MICILFFVEFRCYKQTEIAVICIGKADYIGKRDRDKESAFVCKRISCSGIAVVETILLSL